MVLSSLQLYLEVVLRLCETGRWERYAGRPYELAGGEKLKKTRPPGWWTVVGAPYDPLYGRRLSYEISS